MHIIRNGYYAGCQINYSLKNIRLGDLYYFRFDFSRITHICKFIKVTRKGFNFLDVNTNQCVLKHHLYARGMAGKEFPKNISEVKVWIPSIFDIEKIKQAKAV